MEKYSLLRVIKRKSKQDKVYYLALVIFNTPTDSDILRIVLSEEQANKLVKLSQAQDFSVEKLLSIDYNIYTKNYQPKLNV